MRTATAAMNISNMLPSSVYVLFDDFLYSPNKTTPQKVLTSGSACTKKHSFRCQNLKKSGSAHK
jgi:hypothetical protein